MDLIERALRKEATPETKSTIGKVRYACDTCQRNAQEPVRFRLSMQEEDYRFNYAVFLDFMNLDGNVVLHCDDRDTKYSSATILQRQTAQSIWKAFLDSRVTASLEYSGIIVVDQGRQFVSEKFTTLCRTNEIKMQVSGVESHTALVNGGDFTHVCVIYLTKSETTTQELMTITRSVYL